MAPSEVRFGSILINPDCSNNCIFCSPALSRGTAPITREKEKMLHQDTLKFVREGIENLDVSGSEPLSYPHIIAYLHWIRPQFRRIILLDPGNRLSDPEFARSLASTRIDKIILPIYGSDALHHNRVVGNPGAFDRLIQGIRNLQQHKKGPEIELTSLILKQNLDNLTQLLEFCDTELNLPLERLSLPHLHFPKTHEPINTLDFQPGLNEVRRVILELAKSLHHHLNLGYVPPCIFTDQELLSMENLIFHTTFYLYHLPDHNKTASVLSEVSDYRRQLPTTACASCELAKENLCGGVLKAYLDKNPKFSYTPLSAVTFKRIRPRISCDKANPGAEKEYQKADTSQKA